MYVVLTPTPCVLPRRKPIDRAGDERNWRLRDSTGSFAPARPLSQSWCAWPLRQPTYVGLRSIPCATHARATRRRALPVRDAGPQASSDRDPGAYDD
jgi:hypothetical protein